MMTKRRFPTRSNRLQLARLHKALKNLKIGRKLTLGFGSLVAITLLVVGGSYLAGRIAEVNIQRSQTLRVPTALASASAQENLLRMLSNIRAYLATGEPEYRYRYQETRQAFEADLVKLERLFRDRNTSATSRQQLADLQTAYQEWLELPEQLISLQSNLLDNQPALKLLDEEGQSSIIVIQREIDLMLDEQEQRSPSRTNTELLRNLAEFQSTFALTISALQTYLVTRSPAFRFEYSTLEKTNQLVWQDLLTNQAALTASQQTRLAAIAQQREAFFALPADMFELVDSDEYRQDLLLFQSQAEPLAQEMLGQLTRIVDEQQTTLARELRAGSRSLSVTKWAILVGGLLAVGVGLMMVRLLQQQIAEPIKQLTDVTSRIKEGDLEAKASEASADEVGELARAFNSMANQLQTSFDALRQSEATNRAIVTAIPDLMIRARGNGTYLDIIGSDRPNQTQTVQRFAPGSTVQESLPPDLAQQRLEHIEKALVTGELQVYEQQIMIGDRSQDEEVRILVLSDDEVLIMVRDITARKQNERLKEENLRMGTELNVARQIQQMILPRAEELANVQGLEIAGYMAPADEVGGDYYDVLQTDDIITLGIGDVTGHGLESGLLMLMTQTAVRTLKEVHEPDPVRFLDVLNRTIYQNVQRMNSDRNLTLAILNYSAGRVSISGQHEETLVIRQDGAIERIDTMDLGLPIGLDGEIVDFIDHITVQLQPGDGIVLYTDGIPEAYNPEKEQYGLERFCDVISASWQQPVEAIKQAIIDDVHEFIDNQKVFDDITLLVLKQQ